MESHQEYKERSNDTHAIEVLPLLKAPEMPTAEALKKDKNLFYIYKGDKAKYMLHR